MAIWGGKTHLWMMSGIPVDLGPKDIAGYMKMLEPKYEVQFNDTFRTYCGYEQVTALDTFYNKVVVSETMLNLSR